MAGRTSLAARLDGVFLPEALRIEVRSITGLRSYGDNIDDEMLLTPWAHRIGHDLAEGSPASSLDFLTQMRNSKKGDATMIAEALGIFSRVLSRRIAATWAAGDGQDAKPYLD